MLKASWSYLFGQLQRKGHEVGGELPPESGWTGEVMGVVGAEGVPCATLGADVLVK